MFAILNFGDMPCRLAESRSADIGDRLKARSEAGERPGGLVFVPGTLVIEKPLRAPNPNWKSGMPDRDKCRLHGCCRDAAAGTGRVVVAEAVLRSAEMRINSNISSPCAHFMVMVTTGE
jgi:hypothetical protein